MAEVSLRSVLCLAVVTATLAACDSTSDTPLAPDAQSGDNGVASIVTQIEASWAATGPASGGFRVLHGWDQAPSLYATAWNLCLRATYGIPTPNLSVSATATQLQADLNGQEDRGLPALQRAWLVARGLKWLGQPLPVVALQDVVESSRVGDLYSYQANEAPSWPATQAALEVMEAIGTAPPAALVDRARSDLMKTTSGATDDNFLVGPLPLWMVADRVVPAETRAPARGVLSDVLTRQVERIGAVPGGSSVAILAQIYAIAAANGIQLPPLQRVSLAPLLTPQGYLSLALGDSEPDAQVTCLAASLGFRPSPGLIDSVARTAGPAGWVEWPVNPPDPESSLYSLLALRALGVSWNEGALQHQVTLWMDQLKGGDFSNPGALSDLIFVAALDRELGVVIEPWMSAVVTKLAVSGDGRLDAYLVALARLLGVDLSKAAAMQGRMAGLSPITVSQAWELDQAAAIFQQPAWRDRATHAVSLAMVPSGGFALKQSATVPDLLSTAAGLELLDADPAQRTQAVAAFGSFPRYSIWPPDSGPGNLSNPEALYLGMLADGRSTDSTGLILAQHG